MHALPEALVQVAPETVQESPDLHVPTEEEPPVPVVPFALVLPLEHPSKRQTGKANQSWLRKFRFKFLGVPSLLNVIGNA